MSEHELSEEDVARHWNDNAAAWAREVRQGNDIARERLNNPAFMAFIGDLRGTPSEEYCRAHPSQRVWRDHAALFPYVRAEKPA